MPDLRLEVPQFTSASEWRWMLTDGAGLLASYDVRLDPESWQFEAFTDLDFYASWHAAPDRRASDETRIAEELGDWIGAEVLGPAITTALAQARKHGHVTVRVRLPEALALRPLELARIDGRPLAQRDITLVMAPPGADAPVAKPSGERLRVLGLFSLPDGAQPANLRQARHCLVRLFRRTGAADITVLQYGVTRARLREALEDGEGWDIIHISGHGAPGSLLLETAAGRPDQVTAPELAELLELARDRVKLVTIAACQSAAATGQPHDQPERPAFPESTGATPAAPAASLATELARSLGCAVLAMRFPVTDEFACALTAKLYDLLAVKGRALPSALAITLRQLASGHPALSVTAPALFGASAADLTLKAPKPAVPRTFSTADLKMAGFPPEPDRFVGRVGVMARASAALASESGTPGVVLHGMPGGGKTACALELSYGHEHAFDRLVWFKAPDESSAIDTSLTDFALTLERYLDGFHMAHLVSNAAQLSGFLPRLTELLERHRLLIVIDNAESLLAESAQWRDSRWGQVIGALIGHNGLGRLILTTRRVPSGLTALRTEPVDTLTPGEALLLARELPNLRQLTPSDLANVLHAASGHPKLLELADGQAAHPEQLAALIESSDAPSSTEDYLRVLADWTNTVTDTLSPGERDLFRFLCCLEEPDRERPVLDANWDGLWQRLGRDGNPPELGQALTAVAARSLTALREETGDEPESYAIHPGVAAAGRDRAGPAFQEAVDIHTAALWASVYQRASGVTGDGPVDTRLLVRAGLAAVPYLTRRQQWEIASNLLHTTFVLDRTRVNAAAVLPAIEHIARHDPRQTITLATVLRVLDPAAAETQLRAVIADATARGDYLAAGAAADQLNYLCQESGRLDEALSLTTQKADYTRKADLGPWVQLYDKVQRLQVLAEMGHAREVLDEIHRLRDHMNTLPASPGPNEAGPPWQARELLLGTGCHAACQLGRWQDALDLNAAQLASMRDRRAPAAKTARARFNDHGPLLELGRTDEAIALLLECRQTFQNTRDPQLLGSTLGALAAVENKRGHGDAAIRFVRDALRYAYLAGDVTAIAVGYHNLGHYLHRHASQPVPALVSHLTAALIRTFTGAADADGSVREAAIDLCAFGSAAEPPTNIADLCRQLGDIGGTDPAALITRLAPDPKTAERTLQDLIAQAQALAREAEQEP